MPAPLVSSTRNKHVATAVRLKKRALRERERLFLVEGEQGVAEAIAAGSVEVVFYSEPAHQTLADLAGDGGARVLRVTPEVMERLTSTVTPQGILAVVPFLDAPLAELPGRAQLVALLYAVRDPGNAGTILRSADAAGADAVVFSDGSVDVYNPKTVRASAGSVFHVPVVREADVEDAVEAMRRRGMQVLAADARGERTLEDVELSGPTAVLFGNEAWGIPEAVASLADARVRIPIRGRAESLNLAAAATIFLHEAGRAGSPGVSPVAQRIAAAAHDLRAHLTAASGFARLLAGRWQGLDDAARAEVAGGILQGVERLGVALHRVIDAARVETGGLRLARERVDLSEIVARAGELLPERASVDVEGTVTVTGDPERLLLALLALLENAHAGTGDVRVRVDEADGNARIAVGGAGLSRFPPGEGGELALALDLVDAVARAHGGSVERSPEGVTLVLPVDGPPGGGPEGAR